MTTVFASLTALALLASSAAAPSTAPATGPAATPPAATTSAATAPTSAAATAPTSAAATGPTSAAATGPAAAARQGKPLKTVVGDFVLAGAAHPELARVLSDAAARGVEGAPGLTVLGQSELVAILGLERTRRMLGCTDEQGCNAELATVVEADRLLAGSLTLLDRNALLTVRFIDVRKDQTIARATGTLVDATQAELVDAARRLAHEAVTGQKLDTTGTLRIAVNRTGADVTLDGRSLGDSPVPAQRVLEGPHTVTVQKPGYVRWSTSLSVKAGQEVATRADLVPLRALGEGARSRLWTWGWVSAGVAAAGVAGGIYFGKRADSEHRKYVAATERAAAVDLHDKTKQWTTLANVSWAVTGVAAASATALLVTAIVQDARAARDLAPGTAPAPSRTPSTSPGKSAAVVPIPGGALASVSLAF